jgi:hypothetical protein
MEIIDLTLTYREKREFRHILCAAHCKFTSFIQQSSGQKIIVQTLNIHLNLKSLRGIDNLQLTQVLVKLSLRKTLGSRFTDTRPSCFPSTKLSVYLRFRTYKIHNLAPLTLLIFSCQTLQVASLSLIASSTFLSN